MKKATVSRISTALQPTGATVLLVDLTLEDGSFQQCSTRQSTIGIMAMAALINSGSKRIVEFQADEANWLTAFSVPQP